MRVALEDIARQAIGGDRDALDRLVRALQGDVYGLALRMLWNREDAEDATQEILVRTVTRLAQFDFRSKLKTWVYRIAVNYLLDVKKSPVEQMRLNFQRFGDGSCCGRSKLNPFQAEPRRPRGRRRSANPPVAVAGGGDRGTCFVRVLHVRNQKRLDPDVEIALQKDGIVP